MGIMLAVFIILPVLFLALAFSGVFTKRAINKGDLLKYTNEFEELYDKNEQDFQNELLGFKQLERVKNIVAIIVEIGLLLVGIYELNKGSLWSLFLLVVAILELFAILYLNKKYSKQYKEMFKTCVIKPYVEQSISTLHYEADSFANEEDYKRANFDNKKYNYVTGDDHIFGNVTDKVYMDMSELEVSEVNEKVNKKGKIVSKSRNPRFHGMFVMLKSTLFSFDEIYIKKDKLKLLPQKNRVKIDSIEFEKYFDLYSTNRTEAKRLVNFDVINLLTKFVVESGLTFEIVLKGPTVYMRFFTGAMFEPAIFSKMKEKEMLWTYHMICEFIIEFQRLISTNKYVDESVKSITARFSDGDVEEIEIKDAKEEDLGEVSENTVDLDKELYKNLDD
ncbi:MAG: DUF3137 domain-containing protein [archaeon]|nr:DUF3137 domain-containing protein [archaeon]